MNATVFRWWPWRIIAAGIPAVATGVAVAIEGTAPLLRRDAISEDHPRIFTRIRLKCLVRGEVPERKLQKALDLSAKKYCSVAAMLAGSAQIQHEYEILPGLPQST